ncbi:hypothetical protein HTY54_28310 [Escherichia coli]|nr:hypothetical protein [Escherichia coli]
MWRSNYAPSSSVYSLAAGYPASAITLYAVLAGHGADGGAYGAFPGDVQCGLSTGGRRKVNRLPPWDDV